MAGVHAGLRLQEIDEHEMNAQTAERSRSARKYVGHPLLLAIAWRVPGP